MQYKVLIIIIILYLFNDNGIIRYSFIYNYGCLKLREETFFEISFIFAFIKINRSFKTK